MTQYPWSHLNDTKPSYTIQDERNANAELALADTKYLGTTVGANALRGRSLVLECNRLRILNFNLFPTLHAVRLHCRTSFILLPSRVANMLVFVNTIWAKNWTIYWLTL
jgi:hypothetical protein